jgi:probable rRNA maturation factor
VFERGERRQLGLDDMTEDHQRGTARRGFRDARRSRLAVEIADERGRPMRLCRLTCWLERVAPRRASGRVGIALVSDARMRALNRRYRRIDRPTDVLAFCADPAADPPSERRWLGDIVIARGIARRQAREAGHSDLTELKVLAVHGLLHLLGYDHHADHGQMRRAERRLLMRGGVSTGLIERAGVKSR